jgi:hypothetical protein
VKASFRILFGRSTLQVYRKLIFGHPFFMAMKCLGQKKQKVSIKAIKMYMAFVQSNLTCYYHG